jgi:3-oxoacyl-[acyl-carrier protein] reductase
MDAHIALVTGASRGIGSAIADRLYNDGYKVLKPTRAELDLLSNASIDTYLSNLSEQVDVLVNNAGINLLGSLTEMYDTDLGETLQVNLIAPLRMIRGLAPSMMRLRYGRIVNISSVWSLVSKPRRVSYTLSKTGLNGMTRSLGIELAPYNVLVNAVAPGFVNTELTRKNNSPTEIEALQKMIPVGHLAEPSEVAEVVAFLCSEKNTYIVGQTIFVDGGYTCQ